MGEIYLDQIYVPRERRLPRELDYDHRVRVWPGIPLADEALDYVPLDELGRVEMYRRSRGFITFPPHVPLTRCTRR